MDNTLNPKFDDLIKIANMKMPFGKFKGVALIDLPGKFQDCCRLTLA